MRFEINGLTITATDTLSLGGGFSADGFLIVSDQTFLRLFPKRISGAPNHILVGVRPGVVVEDAAEKLQALYPPATLRVRSLTNAAHEDQSYQTTKRPIGLIFGFGVIMGVMVGIIIVYQVQSTDVADHLREYATFKAMGFRQVFFLGVVFEEALILALLGFVPGIIVSWGIYNVLAGAAGLPLAMSGARAVTVFAGTLAACTVSGAIATRRLASADPADLF